MLCSVSDMLREKIREINKVNRKLDLTAKALEFIALTELLRNKVRHLFAYTQGPQTDD